MKICHITVVHPRYDARIFKRECSSLAAAGHEVVFVCADGKPNEMINGVLITSYTLKNMTKKERFKLLYSSSAFVGYLLSFEADIYQFHDFELAGVGKSLKKHGCHVIFDSHENWFGIIPKYFPKNKLIQKFIAHWLMPFYYSRVISKFDAIFSVSPNMVDDIKKYNTHVYMVSKLPSIKFSKIMDREEKENFFVYQGTVYSISNQESIVQSISSIESNIKYKIIGIISDEIKNIIIKNDAKHRVEFIDWIEKEKLDKIMNKALCGIVVLDYCPICCGEEGQLGSNKIYEYMLCGLPVICTDFKLWKKLIIDKYKCGICVKPGNFQQIKDAIEWIVTHKEEAVEMGQRGREAVIKEFNWEREVPKFLNYYDMIIKGTLQQ